MARFRGLILALALVAAPAMAVEPPGPSGVWTSGSSPNGIANTYSSATAAHTACVVWTGWWISNGSPGYRLTSAAAGGGGCGWEGSNGIGLCYYGAVDNPNISDGRAGYFCGPDIDEAPTPAECLARNVPEAGDPDGRGAADRWFIEGSAPSSYCNGLCTLNVWLTEKPASPGVNPTTGAPVMWTLHHQEYSGGTCTGGNAGEGNPANSPGADPSSQPAAPSGSPPEWSCNPTAGTCTDPLGQINYCTFSGTPPVRQTCVPASGDADGDGIANDQDSAPNDPNNGEDTTGDEGDNVSSGGGSCTSPPVSQGDGIATQIAYQTWATRCAVEALKSQDAAQASSGTGVGLTSGQAADLSAIKSSSASSASAAASAAGQVAALNDKFGEVTDANLASQIADGASATSLGHGTEDSFGASGLDTGGMGASGACPVVPSVDVFGTVLEIDTTIFCDWMQLAGLLVLAFGSLASLRIVAGVAT